MSIMRGSALARTLALLVLGTSVARAQLFVTAQSPSSLIQGGGFGIVSSSSNVARESFHSSNEVRTRGDVRNRVDWQFSERTDTTAVLEIETDAYSVFIPEHEELRCDRDGVCMLETVGDYYDDTTISARIPLELSDPIFVSINVNTDILEGTPQFQLDYFGRSATYATDVATGQLSPTTTLTPDLSTEPSLDVLPFSDQFWIAAGSQLVEFEISSSYLEPGQLFDASSRITIEFTTLRCDADADNDCDLDDLDAMYAAIGSPSRFDFDGDGTTQATDIPLWLANASQPANTSLPFADAVFEFGDLDLSGTVTSFDLGMLLNNFESPMSVGWRGGDFNASGTVTSADLGELLNNFTAETAAVHAVPEPSGSPLLRLALVGFAITLRLAGRAKLRPNREGTRRATDFL